MLLAGFAFELATVCHAAMQGRAGQHCCSNPFQPSPYSYSYSYSLGRELSLLIALTFWRSYEVSVPDLRG
jgi:hypothetical protein